MAYYSFMETPAGHTSGESRRDLFKVPRRSAVEEVRKRLISLIESGQLRVNDQLPSENELARSFGVSRPVIREALVSLHAVGLTSARSGKGTFVASDRVKAMLLQGRYAPAHLNEVRRHLEIPSARIAAERRTDEDLVRLKDILSRMDASEDASQRNKLDAQFHIAIAQATGNPLFVKLVDDLRAMLEEQSLAVSVLPGRRGKASAEHRELYDAILRQDARAAANAMAVHLDAVDDSCEQLGYSPKQNTASKEMILGAS